MFRVKRHGPFVEAKNAIAEIMRDPSRLEDGDDDGYTPLMLAALFDNFELVASLLSINANIEAKDEVVSL